MKKFYAFLLVLTVALSASAYDKLWLIGEVTPYGWVPDQGIEMTKISDTEFTAELSLDGSKYFGITATLSSSWDECNAHRWGPMGNQLLNAGPNPTKFGSGDGFCLVAGDYTITMNTETDILTVGGDVDVEMGTIYLRGELNNWLDGGADEAYAFTTEDETIYTLEVAKLEGGSAWKIANMDWTFKFVAVNTVEDDDAASMHLLLNETYYYTSADYNNALLETAENVLITVDMDEETITLTPGSGVANITVAEEGEAVYYNLQGVRVANPANGLFIRVAGNKAIKVIR